MVITLTYFPALDSPCISSLNLTLSPSINLFTFQFQLLLHMHIINQRQTPQCPSIKQTLLCSQQDKQHLRGYNMASSSVLTHRRVSKSQQTLPSKILPLLLKFFIHGIINIHFLFIFFLLLFLCMCENLPISMFNKYNTTRYEHSSVLLVILPLRGIYSYFKLLPIKNFAARAKRKAQWIKCLASRIWIPRAQANARPVCQLLAIKTLGRQKTGFPKASWLAELAKSESSLFRERSCLII